MDKLNRYRTLIKQFLEVKAELANRCVRDGSETVRAFDEKRDQYLLMNVGWAGERRVRGTNLFLRIVDDKIWIEDDWTEEGIATELVANGVAKEDIVLAFQPPSLRRFGDFAVA